MVRINNKFDFDVYQFDTFQTVAERLAAVMNTLPKYLYLEVPVKTISEFREKENETIGDLLTDMKVRKLPQILSSLDKNQFLVKKELDIMDDVVAPYVAYNTTLQNAEKEMRGILLLQIQKNFSDGTVVPSQLFWRNKDKTQHNIIRAIETNKHKVKGVQVLGSEKGIPHTEFTPHEATLRLEFDPKGLTLLEIFDKIKLTPKVPFASANNFYKILRDFTPTPTLGDTDDHIYFQFRSSPLSKDPKFFDTVLVIDRENGQEKCVVQTGSIDYKQGFKIEDFLFNFKEVFGARLALKITKSSLSREKGRFYYRLGEKPIDSYVLGDLVMNDPLFNKFLSIDDHEAATKGKRGSTYIHFFGDGDDEQTVKANITIYKVRDKDEVLRRYGYKKGEYYLNVLVSNAKSRSALEDFMTIFGKLISLYHKKAPQIVKIYQSLLSPTIFPPVYKPRKPLPKGKKTKVTLKEQAPEVFVSGYPTKCANQPRIISRVESKDHDNVMEYPKTPDEGFPQRWYVCDEHPSHPYPGLRVNDLSNKNIVPYLPCCFKTRQDIKEDKSKQTKPYAHYFYDIPVVSGTAINQQNLLTRDLFADPTRSGSLLPEKLNEMLNLVTYRPDWTFVRTGVFDSKSSFLECVLEALQEHSGNKDIAKRFEEILQYNSKEVHTAYDNVVRLEKEGSKTKRNILADAKAKLWEAKKTERIQLLNEYRIKLSTKPASCSQEMYDYSEDEILKSIRDPDIYFDPRLFTNLIEKYFNCKIVLFSRVTPGTREHEYVGNDTADLKIPRHVQAYYKTKEKVPTILIYERLGRGTEQKEYPRCELITYWDGAKELKTLHEPGSSVSKQMEILYEKVRASYNLNCPVSQSILPLDKLRENVKLTHQEIDSYGKCRALIFQYKGQTGSLLVTPIQPLLLPRFDDQVTPRLSFEVATKILEFLPVRNKVETASDYSGVIGNVRFSLPFKPEIPSGRKSLVTEKDLLTRDQTGSRLSAYVAGKRIARYMVEYVRWLYSKFLGDKESSIESLQQFVEQKIKVDEDYKYGHIGKNFNMNGGMTKKGVLIVNSEETRKRLIYTLQLYELNQPEDLKQYKSRTSISDYFLNVGDFTRYRSQVILQGDDAVLKWINERGQDYYLHNEVVTSDKMEELRKSIEKLNRRKGLEELLEEKNSEYEQLELKMLNSPRFFKNSLMGDNEIYLYQEATGLPQALKICNNWTQKSFNDGRNINKSETELLPTEDFTLYSYQNPTNIIPYVCEEGCQLGSNSKVNDSASVIGYKDYDNNPTFISILPLGSC